MRDLKGQRPFFILSLRKLRQNKALNLQASQVNF